jgi:hypothetical protein
MELVLARISLCSTPREKELSNRQVGINLGLVCVGDGKASTANATYIPTNNEQVFVSARQALETFLNHPKTLKMPTTRYFTKVKVSLVSSLIFKTVFGIFLAPHGLSQICKIKNFWKLPSPFSRNTLIPSSETTSK